MEEKDCLQSISGNIWRYFFLSQVGVTEARGADKESTIHRTAPNNMEFSITNINSKEVDNSLCKQKKKANC
jgi:hypothetical protein